MHFNTRVLIHKPFLRTFFSLVLQIFLYLETFECNTTSDWLNHSCVTIKFTNLDEKGKECSGKMVRKNALHIFFCFNLGHIVFQFLKEKKNLIGQNR